jgi:hypothetical protein
MGKLRRSLLKKATISQVFSCSVCLLLVKLKKKARLRTVVFLSIQRTHMYFLQYEYGTKLSCRYSYCTFVVKTRCFDYFFFVTDRLPDA